MNNGFLKFELLMGEHNEGFKAKDKVFATVYDMIVAAKAQHFSTCIPDACRKSFCMQCGYNSSKFVALTTRDSKKNSVKFWPEQPADVLNSYK